MEEKIKTLYELCDIVSKELKDAVEKIRQGGGKLSAGDVDYIDKLAHTVKSIKTTIAMMEAEDEGGYSQAGTMQYPMPRSMRSMRGGSYEGGSYRGSYNSYEGNGGSYEGDSSYARRGSYRQRDSMGRYSSERGYSNHGSMDDILEDMREMMGELPEDQRKEVQRFVDKMDRM